MILHIHKDLQEMIVILKHHIWMKENSYYID